MKTTANSDTKIAMNAAHMNPYVTSLTLKEIPHCRKYAKELKAGDTIAIFVSTSSIVFEGYFVWKKIRTISENNEVYSFNFTDGTNTKIRKFSANKWEVMK